VLAAYLLVVVCALWLTDGRALLMAMPLVSLLVLYLPLRVALAIDAALLAWSVFTLPLDPLQVVVGFGSAFVFVVVFSLIARRERYARAEIERLSTELEVLATARERNRIAREIHDSVGHYLTVANVQLEAARAMETGRDERLARVQGLLKEGLGQLRESVSMLRETMPSERPFATALQELVSASSSSGLAVELRVLGPPRPLPGAVGFTLFRATQEALTNAQRHAGARRIDVALEYAQAQVRLEVHDDGRGLPAGGLQPGNGLRGMRERVELLGGALQLQGRASGGLTLAIEVPT
jgi:signal transduction histidine kinase